MNEHYSIKKSDILQSLRKYLENSKIDNQFTWIASKKCLARIQRHGHDLINFAIIGYPSDYIVIPYYVIASRKIMKLSDYIDEIVRSDKYSGSIMTNFIHFGAQSHYPINSHDTLANASKKIAEVFAEKVIPLSNSLTGNKEIGQYIRSQGGSISKTMSPQLMISQHFAMKLANCAPDMSEYFGEKANLPLYSKLIARYVSYLEQFDAITD